MIHVYKFILFFILLFLFNFNTNCNCNKPPMNKINMEKTKKDVLDAWEIGNEALENADWEAYSNYWAHRDYIQIIHPKEKEWLRGWESVGPGYKDFIEQGVQIQTKASDVNIRVSDDSTMAWLTCKMQIRMESDDTLEFESWQTNIFENIDGEWKLVHGHASNLY